MTMQVSLFAVSRIKVTANGCALAPPRLGMHWWQELELFDDRETVIGRIVLHLVRAEVALPVGDQPPYWGIDPQRIPAAMDGESPF
jgi:hypothetical protein